MIELRACDTQQEWDDYILEHSGHPLQLWSWGEVKAAHGWKALRLFALVDGEVIGAAQVLVRSLPSPFRSFSYIPRGPLFHAKYKEEQLESIAQYVKEQYHSVALSIEPDSNEFTVQKPWVRSTNKVLSAETILLDLNKSEDELLSDMAKKTRQYIRKSSQEIEVRRVKTHDDLKACLDLYKQTAKRAGFNLHTDAYYIDVFEKMDEYSPIFMAISREIPVAFLWLAVSEETAYELYGGMNEEGQSLRANYALKWHAIQKVKEWGIHRYDFGGLVAGGVSNFKQGWSKDITEFPGTFDRPLSPLYILWSKGLPFAKRVLQKIRRR